MPRKKSKSVKTKKNNKALDQAKRQGLGFIVAGGILVSIAIGYRIQQAVRLSFNVSSDDLPTATQTLAKPTQLRLPKYRVTLDIVESAIHNGVWQINEYAANHLNVSANPGEGGNVVIYGHNSNEVLGPLRWMSVGEQIELTNADGKTITYSVDQVIETNPEDINWVLPKQEETLTLYTCSGFLNSKRHIVIARPVQQ